MKNMSMQVKEIMSKDIVKVISETGFLEMNKMFHKYNLHQLPVIDNGKVVGLIQSSVLHKLLEEFDFDVQALKNLLARDIMDKDVACILSEASVKEAAKYFLTTGSHALPVVDHENNLMGMLSTTDLINVICDGDSQ